MDQQLVYDISARLKVRREVLADETFLSDELLRQLMSVGEVDLLVGILAHSSANTMRRAAHCIENSLQQNFVRQRVAIISVDGGAVEDDYDDASSGNGQPSLGSHLKGLSTLRTIHRITAGFGGCTFSWSGHAHDSFFRGPVACQGLRDRVSRHFQHIAGLRYANLLRPAFRDSYDFVSPLYSRHKFRAFWRVISCTP